MAKKAMLALWSRRSALNLLGNQFDVVRDVWTDTASTIGAGTDSFFEYLLKGHVLFQDAELLSIFDTAYRAIEAQLLDTNSVFYRAVNMHTGVPLDAHVDALSSFYPGLQVLYGRVSDAVRAFEPYAAMFKRFGVLPEAMSPDQRTMASDVFELRPEFVESAYLLYQGTRDPLYLHLGESFVEAMERQCRTPCGYASICVSTGQQLDRMESFVLSETLAYLYLLLSPSHWIHVRLPAAVFSTEAHPLWIPADARIRSFGQPAKMQPCKRFTTASVFDTEHVQVLARRIKVSWAIGLPFPGIREFDGFWRTRLEFTPTPAAIFLKPQVAAVQPAKDMLMLDRQGAKTLRVEPWPDVCQPAFRTVGCGQRLTLLQGVSDATGPWSIVMLRKGQKRIYALAFGAVGSQIEICRQCPVSWLHAHCLMPTDAMASTTTLHLSTFLVASFDLESSFWTKAIASQSRVLAVSPSDYAYLEAASLAVFRVKRVRRGMQRHVASMFAQQAVQVYFMGLPIWNARLLRVPRQLFDKVQSAQVSFPWASWL